MHSVRLFFAFGKRLRRACVAVAVAIALSAAAAARTRDSSATGGEYVGALQAANSFLHAWQTHDSETGLLMLSDGAKKRTTEEKLHAFFAARALSTQGFLITTGRKLKPGKYVFGIAMLESVSEKETIRRHFSRIVLVRAGKQDWAVDNIP